MLESRVHFVDKNVENGSMLLLNFVNLILINPWKGGLRKDNNIKDWHIIIS